MILDFSWLLVVVLVMQICLISSAKPTNDPDITSGKLKCYVCFWSQNHEPCGDLNFTIVPSQATKYMVKCLACYKKVLYASTGEKLKILRGCAQVHPYYALSCQKLYNEDESYTETCACTSEYCNAAQPSPHWHHCLVPVSLLVWFVFSRSF